MPELVIATQNRGKFGEIRSFLSLKHPHLKCVPLWTIDRIPSVVEDGSSFLENARKKATIISSFTGKPVLADDSGLEVDALGGRPGVFSARFAGPQATDAENLQKLIDKMREVPAGQRGARFRCAMVLRSPKGESRTAVGELKGEIIGTPRGSNGFGFDPVFLVPEGGRTLAEMTTLEKNRLSHRARALEKISGFLGDFMASI